MSRKTVDRSDLEKLGIRLVNEFETGDFALSDEAREAVEIDTDEITDSATLIRKTLASAYCMGYAIGYLRAKDRRFVTAEVEKVSLTEC